MHRRCCWPPDRPPAGARQPVLHLVPEAGAAEGALEQLVALRPAQPHAREARARPDVVGDRLGRERVGPLEDHPDRAADRDRVGPASVDVLAAQAAPGPRAVASGTSSCIRFSVRMNVDFPQPDGPMMRRDRVARGRPGSRPRARGGGRRRRCTPRLPSAARASAAGPAPARRGRGGRGRRGGRAGGGAVGRHRPSRGRARAAMRRATRFRTRMIATSTRAAPHASSQRLRRSAR